MANVRKLQVSFSGGEVSGEFFGRSDDAKFQSGASILRNMMVLPHGPVQNRAGFAFVREVKDSGKAVRLIPFTFSTTQTMVIEMGEGYFRFHTDGATLLVPAGVAAYSAVAKYNTGDLVTSGGEVYYCSSPVTGVAPPDTTYWHQQPATGEYEIPNDYAEADIFSVHYVQSGDVLTLVHQNHPPTELRRLGATTWVTNEILFAPTLPPPGALTGETPSPIAHTYKITGRAFYTDTVLQYLFVTIPSASVTVNNDLTIDGAFNLIKWVSPGLITAWDVYKLVGSTYYYLGGTAGASFVDDRSKVPNLNSPQPAGAVSNYIATSLSASASTGGGAVNATATGSGSTVYTYCITSLSSDGRVESIASPTVSCSNNLLTTGNYNTITWSRVPGVDVYNVYKESNGIFGFIGQGTTSSFRDDNIAPDLSRTPPIHQQPFTTDGNYPAAVSYFEQRRCFAGTINSPQSIWMTKPGSESDLAYSLPSREDDAIAFRVAAREVNTIRHLVPLNDLVALTSAAEWRVTSINADALTPSTISVRPQSYVGANEAQPIVVNNTLIYAAARGGHVRELAYNWQAGGYLTGDLSLRATHLFDTHDIVDMAYAKAPYPVAWFVSNNGNLLGLTYVPEQQVGAWHRHDTIDGAFESITVVAEGGEDRLYAVISRDIDGTPVRYIERMASRLFTDQADAFFVDAGATFDGNNTSATTMALTGGTSWDDDEVLTLTSSAPAFVFPGTTDVGDQVVMTAADGTVVQLTVESTSSATVAVVRPDKVVPADLRGAALAEWAWARDSISGLDHLEGCTVSILADGAVHPQRVVTGGSITLDQPAVKVHVGLPIEADLQTLPLSVALRDGSSGQGRQKNINRAWLRVHRSSGVFVGPSVDELVEAKQRTTEPYGSPPALKSEEIEVVVSPGWDDDGQVYVRQADPLPLTIVALTLEVALGG